MSSKNFARGGGAPATTAIALSQMVDSPSIGGASFLASGGQPAVNVPGGGGGGCILLGYLRIRMTVINNENVCPDSK